VSTVAVPTSPFKGLAPFDDSDVDALLFFGRGRETEVIVANLQASRLTVLYGPSGVGKSSVLRAGVAHRLRQEQDAAVELVDSWAGDAAAALRDALGARPENGDLYLILDQFDEFFLYHADDSELAALLADVVGERGLRVNVLIGIRDDALAQLDSLRRPIPNLLANRLSLDRLDRESARAAVVGPIERYNHLTGEDVAAEPELIETVLDQVATGRVDLGRAGRGGVDGQEELERVEAPYLQLVLERLWRAEREEGSRRLRLETLERLGGASRIVHDHLEHAMADLTPEEKEAAAAMYDHLVTPSGTKIAHRIGDLARYASVAEPEAGRVLSKLVDERIVRASSDDGPAATRYEIFHDVLAGAVLAWRARHEERRALRVAEERRRRALRIAAAALAGLLIVAAIAVYALVERRTARSQADRARARELTANALGALDTDPAASVRLAYDAARLEPGLREENVLRNSLAADRLRRTLHAGGPVAAVAFDRSGRVLTARADGRIRVEPGPAVDHGSRLTVAAFDPTARFVISGGEDGVVRVWDSRSGRRLARLAARGPVRSAVFARSGRLLVTAAGNGWIGMWRTKGWRHVRSFYAGPGDLVRASVDRGGARIAVVTRDRYVQVFDATTGKRLRRLRGDGFAGDAVFSPDGRSLATSDYLGHVRLWRSVDVRPIRSLLGGQRNISDLAWSPDGTKLAAASADATARVWEVATGLQLFAVIHSEEVTAVEFTPDSENLLTVAGSTARVWGATPDKAGRPISVLAGHTAPISSVAVSPDGRKVVTGSLDRTARLWDPGSELELQPIVRRHVPFTALVPTSSGERVVAGDGAGVVGTWTLAGQPLGPSLHLHGPVDDLVSLPNRPIWAAAGTESIAAAPDGSSKATANGSTLTVFPEARRSRITRQVAGGPIHDLAFSPDGRSLAVALDDGTAQIWSLGPLRRVHVLHGHRLAVLSVAFSHDGRYVVTGSADADARVWSTRTGRSVRLLHGHFGPVRAVSFSRDDRVVLTAGPTVAGVWNLATNEHGFLRGPTTDLLTSAVWAGRDGWTVVTSSRGGTLRTYHCDLCGNVDELVALAKRRLDAQR
jgi:WD40 repeat protein